MHISDKLSPAIPFFRIQGIGTLRMQSQGTGTNKAKSITCEAIGVYYPKYTLT